ncbi:hypothetical protein ACIHCM_02355 [Streptomyces sp. NPDC052023]
MSLHDPRALFPDRTPQKSPQRGRTQGLIDLSHRGAGRAPEYR